MPGGNRTHVTLPSSRGWPGCRPPAGPYERLTRRASGAYDSLATVYVMHVGLLASDGCFSSGLTALIDILSTAEAERPGADPSIPPIRIDVTGTGRKVTTGAIRTTQGRAVNRLPDRSALLGRTGDEDTFRVGEAPNLAGHARVADSIPAKP
jgi:hypothetical protein